MVEDPIAELHLLTFPQQEDMSVHPHDYGELALLDAQIYGLAASQAIDAAARSHFVKRLVSIRSRLPLNSKAYPYIRALIKIVDHSDYHSKG